MNISGSSNAYNALSSTNNGFSGMISGMDTESMVQKMLMGQQNKIDKQKASKQTALWKQGIYREKITKINNFQKKFFDINSSTNLVSNTFFNQMSSTSESKAFRITGSSSAAISGSMRMKIDQLATSTTLEGEALSNANPIEGTFNMDAFNARVAFEYSRPLINDKGEPIVDRDGNPVFDSVGGKIALDDTQVRKIMAGEEVEITVPGNTDPDATDKNPYTIKLSVKNSKLTIDSKLKLKVLEPKIDTTPRPRISSTSLGLEMLGLSAGKTSTADGKMIGKIKHDAAPTLDITFDGIKKTITLDKEETIDTFKEKIVFAFGADANGIKVEGTSMSDFKLTTTTGRRIVIGGSESGLAATELKSGQSNVIGAGDTLENAFGVTGDDAEGNFKITINNVEIALNKNDTVSQLRSKISNSGADVELKYSEFENKFVLSRKSSGAGFEISFGADSQNLLSKVLGRNTTDPNVDGQDGYSVGVNAKVTVDGIQTERSSNNFTINGISFELLATTAADDEGTINTIRDTESIHAGIKAFVDDYNALIKELNDLIGEDADYKDYPPLTDAQRKDMSTSEIAAWEKKAQVGLLKGDNDISSFLSEMRTAIFQKPDSAKYAMYDIGIDTSSEMKDKGKLKLDDAKLKEMLNKDPAAIQELFTFSKTKQVFNTGKGEYETVPDGVQGIGTAFKNAIKSAASTSSGSPGTLVLTAGYADTGTDKRNALFDQMEAATKRIETLTFQYNRQKERYWKQFNAMENVLSNLTAQSSWLTQQTSGM